MRLVVEADGGSRGNPGPAAYGALVRDAESGEVLAEEAEFLGTATNNVAEYSGLVAGLRAAARLDPGAEVEVRMDSKLVVEQMSGRWQIKHADMRDLAAAARDAFAAAQVRYTWVPRGQNTDADRLVNQALDVATGRERPPVRAVAADPYRGAGVDAAPVDASAANVLVGWAGDLGVPTTTVLLRHGETSHTSAKRFSGSGGDDPGLTEAGRAQAAAAAAVLAGGPRIDAVVASPLRRTVETAGVVAEALGSTVRVDDGWRETAFGEWDGRSFAEVRQTWPDELDAWLRSTAVAPPGGESMDDVAVRVRVAKDRLLARHPAARVLVVTHVTPIKELVRAALEAPAHSVFRMELSPASITTLRWFPSGQGSVVTFNDAGHVR